MSDERLFHGAVPQPADWLRVWRYTKSFESCRKSESFTLTEEFIASSRKEVKPLHHKAIRNMQDILADTVRGRKREDLWHAKAISLQLDDKAPYRAILYKASLQLEGEQKTVGGILCILQNSGKTDDINEYEEDYAIRVRNSVLSGVTKFCTDVFGHLDVPLEDHILSRCLLFAGDGAVLKAGKLLKSKMPNLVLARVLDAFVATNLFY